MRRTTRLRDYMIVEGAGRVRTSVDTTHPAATGALWVPDRRAWTVREGNRFVWIRSHDGTEESERPDLEYYASAERAAMDPDPARLVARNETSGLEPVA